MQSNNCALSPIAWLLIVYRNASYRLHIRCSQAKGATRGAKGDAQHDTAEVPTLAIFMLWFQSVLSL